jgi:hypothetical protein
MGGFYPVARPHEKLQQNPTTSSATSFAPAPATTSMSLPTTVAGFISAVPPMRSQSSVPRSLNSSCSSRRQVWRER